jgi:uncharacterized protein DUF742
MNSGRESWYDDDAGPLVRPYQVTRGRTQSRPDLNMITLVVAANTEAGNLDPEYAAILRLCQVPTSVAEISATLSLPLAVVKILISDLIEGRLLIFSSPHLDSSVPDMETLQAVLDGIRRL